MTIPLRPQLKAELRPVIVEAILNSEIEEGGHFDGQALTDISGRCDQITANKKNIVEPLERFIRSDPFKWAMYCFVSEKVAQANLPQDSPEQPLTSIPSLSDPDAAAEEFLSLLENLPNSYICSIALSRKVAVTWKLRNLPAIVGQTIAVVGSWHPEANQFPVLAAPLVATNLAQIFASSKGADGDDPLPKAPSQTLGELQKPWRQPDVLAIHITVHGFISGHMTTEPTEEAIRVLKSFVGLGFATKVLGRTYIYGEDPTVEALFFDGRDITNRVTMKTLDRALSQVLRSLLFRTSIPNFIERLQDVIDIVDGNPRSDQLVLAGRWLCDSHANHDKGMSFMQAAIVIEVLLGTPDGKEEVGLTTLLANRCAYLVAKNTDERDQLLKSFPKIYETRSKIVHRGLWKSNDGAAAQLSELHKLCNRVIDAEIDQLLATRPEPPRATALRD
ncbi:HEPN domain-containing protein [Variovorax paradoxus]|uniref:Uncharacterized protein n=1 Tax=Variovorax paradoxus TaxID=34073 RepID=A0A0H2M668_VARPD|nr:HEPN domain-containing protein [Variovorax paradoxus]KLN57636.1 hypothetical protein VPARA_11490 [Variovorax paradoxus]